MHQRLREIRMQLGLNQTEFGKYLGLSQTSYSMIENNVRPLADKYIKVICATFNISENWLRFGEGEMFSSSPYEKELLEIFRKLTPELQAFLLIIRRKLFEIR